LLKFAVSESFDLVRHLYSLPKLTVVNSRKSTRSKRHRGYILTPAGATKLKNRIRELEAKTGVKYNPSKISQKAQLISSQGLHPTTIRKILRGTSGGDEASLRLIFQVLELQLEEQDYTQPGLDEIVQIDSYQDWGEAIDVSVFYGRNTELESLQQLILQQNFRLIAIVGMGGIGKTSLSIKLTQQIQTHFQFVIWRSLRNAPLLEDLLPELLQFLSQNNPDEITLAKTISVQISQLIDAFRNARCLLVLDNVETILQQGSPAGRYCLGYESYGELLRRIAQTTHQSCLILTSREKPQGIAAIEGEFLPVHFWQLEGLPDEESQKILNAKGLNGTFQQIKNLTQRYQGNPLALKIVATSVQELFAGNLGEFLAQGISVFNGIRNLLTQQFERLAPLEKQILYWLMINREPVTLSQLREDLLPPVALSRILDSLEFIGWRSLIELQTEPITGIQQFTLQPVVMEYVTERFIEQICAELQHTSESETLASLHLFRYHALIKAQSQNYVRLSQIKLILEPILSELLSSFGSTENLAHILTGILNRLRHESPATPGYIAGNVVNLLVHLQIDLSNYDFSGLTIWQAAFQGVNLRRVNFSQANLAKSIFSETFSNIYSLTLNPTGTLLVTGHANGELCLWRVADGKLLLRRLEHSSTIWSINFSPDGQTIATSSFDGLIRLWQLDPFQPHSIIFRHSDRVWAGQFSPNGRYLASCSSDQTVKLWDCQTGECLQTLQGHTDIIQTLAFHPKGHILASGSADQTIRLWYLSTGECYQMLRGHTQPVIKVAFHPEGHTLASCDTQTVQLWNLQTGQSDSQPPQDLTFIWTIAWSAEGKTLAISDTTTIKLWDIHTQQYQTVRPAFSSQVLSISFDHSGSILAGSDRQTIKLWQLDASGKGKLLQTLQGYTNPIQAVALSADGKTLVAGSSDHTLSFWNLTHQDTADVVFQPCLSFVQHPQKSIRSLAFSPDHQSLASAGDDPTLRLFNRHTGKLQTKLIGHTQGVWSVAWSPAGKYLASGSSDQTIRLWHIQQERTSKVFYGHQSWVLSVAFHPEGTILASSSADQTIKLWDITTGQCLKTLFGHQGFIWSVVFVSPQRLASAGEDSTIKLWNLETGECEQTLCEHHSIVWSIAFHPQTQCLASGSADQTIKLWDITTGRCLKTLEEHTNAINAVALSPHEPILVSGSHDESIKLWDVSTGTCLQTLQPEKIYEGMNITQTTGLTEAQQATLKALGAIDL
jgi:WD40 repeat protein